MPHVYINTFIYIYKYSYIDTYYTIHKHIYNYVYIQNIQNDISINGECEPAMEVFHSSNNHRVERRDNRSMYSILGLFHLPPSFSIALYLSFHLEQKDQPPSRLFVKGLFGRWTIFVMW